MANPQDTGGFEVWWGERLMPAEVAPKTGDTGGMETWYGERLWPEDYVAAPASGAALTATVAAVSTVSASLSVSKRLAATIGAVSGMGAVFLPSGPIYYVDTATGSDADDGLSSANAKLTLQAAATTIGNTSATILVSAASGTPLRELVTVATTGTLTIRGAGGTPWYIEGAETHSAGFTSLGGGIYSKDLGWAVVGDYCWVTTLLETNGIELKRLLRNNSTPTVPTPGSFGTSGNTIYVRMPADQDPATNPFIIPRYGTTLKMTGSGTLNVADAFSRYAGDGNYQQTGGHTTFTDCTAEYSTTAAGAGGGGFTITGGGLTQICTNCTSRFAFNDGYNGHGTGTMTLNACNGSYNHGQGCSVHDTFTLNVVGGRYHNNGIGGMLSINSSVVNLSGGARFDHNLDGSPQGIAGVHYFASTMSGVIENIETDNNVGAGYIIAVGADVTGCGVNSHDNGAADSGPVFPSCASTGGRRRRRGRFGALGQFAVFAR